MKSFICTMIVSVVIAVEGHSCEICGCGNNNFQVGILPTFSKGFFGVRYTGSQFHSIVQGDATQFSHDYYKTTEIWGGYNLKRFQLMAFVPYLNARKVSDDGTSVSNGLGDVLLLTNYKVLSTTRLSKSEVVTVRNELYLGVGVKLPTGVNRVDTRNPAFNIGNFNSQAGTGSIDYLFNITHNLMWNRQGVVTNVAYRINSTNQQDYRFGNRSYFNSSYYYTFTVSTAKIKPNAGVNLQRNAINSYSGSPVEHSDGYNLNSTVGLNVLFKKVGFNVMTFFPVAQNMYNGQTRLQSRMILGLTYSL